MARIDQHGPEGKALQTTVKAKLRDYLGADYSDEVLPLYIVVMLAHQTQERVVAENLEAFLGDNAVDFTSWLFQHLGNVSKAKTLRIGDEEAVQPAAIALEAEPPALTAAPAAAKSAAAAAATATRRGREQDAVSLSGSADMSDGEHDEAVEQPANARDSNGHAAEPHSDRRERDGRRHDEQKPRRHPDHRRDEQRDRRYSGHDPDERRHSDRGWPDEHTSEIRASRDSLRRDEERRWRSDRAYGNHSHVHRGQCPDWGHPLHEWGPSHADPHSGGYWAPPPPPPPGYWPSSYGYAPPRDTPLDRHYRSHNTGRRHRSLSPARHGYRSSGRSHDQSAGYSGHGDRSRRRNAEASDRWNMHAGSRGRSPARDGSAVPPEVDFEAKAQDVPPEYRRRLPSQLARPVVSEHQNQQQQVHQRQQDVPAQTAGDCDVQNRPASNGRAADAPQQQSARERLSGLRSSAPEFQLVSRSLPNPVAQQNVQPGHVPRPAQHGSTVFDRLAGRQPASNGVLAYDYQPSQPVVTHQPAVGHEPRLIYQQTAPAAPAGGEISEIQAQLQQMSGILQQLRAAARLEASTRSSSSDRGSVFGRIGRPAVLITPQGPSSSRSVTATSVHPLALEHTAILRAHFSITGRILRTTVLRDQKTGIPSGKVHVEYDTVLAARKALQLSRSLLLDRPVYVKLKKH